MAELPADLPPDVRERYQAVERKRAALQAGRETAAHAPRSMAARERRPLQLVDLRSLELPDALLESDADRAERLERERAAAERAEQQRQADARRARFERVRALRIPLAKADELALVDGTLDLQFGASIRHVVEWLADPNAEPWLVLCGGTGCGKTLAAAYALLKLGGRYVTSQDLDRLYASHFGPEIEAWRESRDKRELLVIDDAGARLENVERVTSALLDLADYRRGDGNRTILIANVVAEKLRKRYDEPRLWSRLEQAGCLRARADGGADARARGAR